jgi:hypothetical protein
VLLLVEPKACLRAQDALGGDGNAGLGNPPRLHGRLDCRERSWRVRQVNQHVVTRPHRTHGGLGRRQQPRDTLHLHGIGEDQSAEREVAPQQAHDDRLTERYRRGRREIEGRHRDVRGRYRARAGLDARPERRQLDLVESSTLV